MKNIIIITGASSGIGQEFALQIDNAFSNIDEIWLIARREERLQELARVMDHTTRLIVMDLTDEYAMDDLEQLMEEEKICIRMLVNAAGFGLMGSFEELSLEDQLDMLHLNCEALTRMTYLCLPYMKRGSRIIQLASSAAFLPQQDFAVYAASKSYVLSFSRALNRELTSQGIYVTAVCPGPVSTEFFTIAEQFGTTLDIKKHVMITAEKCVSEALRDSYHKKEVSVPGLIMKAFLLVTKTFPHSTILSFVQLLK